MQKILNSSKKYLSGRNWDVGGVEQRHVGQLPGGGQPRRGQALRELLRDEGGDECDDDDDNDDDDDIDDDDDDIQDGNNAGEWLSYDPDTGDIMIYTDSDTAYGFGFLKLSPA